MFAGGVPGRRRAQSSPKFANARRLSGGAALAARKNSLAQWKPLDDLANRGIANSPGRYE
jgi:hypothetical protein